MQLPAPGLNYGGLPLRLRSLARRRPSPAIVISSAALFMSLGGVGYAAVSIPNNSVGQSQLKNDSVSYTKIVPNAVGNVRLANNGVSNAKIANNAVSYKKIQAGAVGTVRANLDQLQARLKTTCGAGSAVGAVDSKGTVTCNSTLPSEFAAASTTSAVTGTAAAVSAVTLPAGPTYLAFANPVLTVTSGAAAQRVAVSCTLTVGSGVETRTGVVATSGTVGQTSSRSIPLQAAGTAGASSVSCSASVPSGTLPAITATSGINALATASNS